MWRLFKYNQPPSGGCVLKQKLVDCLKDGTTQPPSGGCVLKQDGEMPNENEESQPPSGGCVLKRRMSIVKLIPEYPAAFGRLCVETRCCVFASPPLGSSRLRAAVC